MASSSNIFARYVWLIDLILRHSSLSFEEISEYWSKSGLSFGETLPLRTFHNHRHAIADIFGIDIVCDIKGKNSRYHIEGEEYLQDDRFRKWLLDSMSVANRINECNTLHKRISFEYNPSSNCWLTILVDAIRCNHFIEIEYSGYVNQKSHTFEIKPYGLKVYNRRWYLLAHNEKYGEIRTYSLDRIRDIRIIPKSFDMPKDFDINEYYSEYPGINHDNSVPLEVIEIKVRGLARNFIEDLPLHISQRKIQEDNASVTYRYKLRRPTIL